MGPIVTIGAGCAPAGLAVNAARRQALLGCSGQLVVVWDLARHQLVKVDHAAGGGDLATYSPAADQYLFAADAYAGGPEIAVFRGSGAYKTAVGLPAAAKSAAGERSRRSRSTIGRPTRTRARPRPSRAISPSARRSARSP